MDGVGITTAAVVFGGQQDPAATDKVYDYNGTSWTAANDMNSNHGGQHFVSGTVTDAIIGAGGSPYPAAAQAETYDGTSFTNDATLSTVGQRGGKGSTVAAAIACGGHPPFLAVTEEYTAAGPQTKTVTTG